MVSKKVIFFNFYLSQPILYLMVSHFGCMYLTFMSRELCLRFLFFVLCQKTGNFMIIYLNIFF